LTVCFAFAFFDLDKLTRLLGSRWIGGKPLYFSLQGGVLSFASEIKAWWPLHWIDKKVNDFGLVPLFNVYGTPARLLFLTGFINYCRLLCRNRCTQNAFSFREWYQPWETLQLGETPKNMHLKHFVFNVSKIFYLNQPKNV
jgi:asparagine synthetase B (glutamine-hydrolysing)